MSDVKLVVPATSRWVVLGLYARNALAEGTTAATSRPRAVRVQLVTMVRALASLHARLALRARTKTSATDLVRSVLLAPTGPTQAPQNVRHALTARTLRI